MLSCEEDGYSHDPLQEHGAKNGLGFIDKGPRIDDRVPMRFGRLEDLKNMNQNERQMNIQLSLEFIVWG